MSTWPKTEDVRAVWDRHRDRAYGARREFDQWIRRVKAAAFSAGYDAGWSDRNSAATTGVYPPDTYRAGRANPWQEEA